MLTPMSRVTAMVSNFSRGYLLCEEIEVRTWPKSEAVMAHDLHEELEDLAGGDVVGFVGGVHYHFRPERGIPGLTAVIPEDNHHDEPRAFLLQA